MRIEKRAKRKIDSVTDNCGTFKVYSEGKIIYCGFSRNIKMGLQRLVKRLKENRYRKYIKCISNIETEETTTPLEALIKHKKNVINLDPEFEEMVRLYDDYVYLAVDFNNPPFLKLVETTQEKYFYIGPFRSRFFIPDLIQTMNDLFKLPFCEQDEYPCVKLRKRTCKGYCVEEKEDFATDFFKYFLDTKNKEYLTYLQQYENYFENLEFQKAENLSDSLRIVKKYFGHQQLILSMKNLDINFDFKGAEIIVKNGLINKLIVKESNETFEFPTEQIEYRDNEMMAIDKAQFYEMFVLFNFLKKEYPKEIDQNSKNNFSRIKKYFSK